jgi:ferredoxin-type protein NapH
MFFDLQDIRRATQIAWLFVCNAYVSIFTQRITYKGPLRSTCLPVLYCHACPSATFSCPIGTMQYYLALHKAPFFLLGHMGLICLCIGRMPCGWLCPFGLVQDVMYRIRSVKIALPKYLTAGRWFALGILVVLLPWVTHENWFSKLCPWGAITAGIPWVVWNPINPETGAPYVAPGSVGLLFAIKLLIVVGFLILFVVHKRPFCRYVCPLGLLFSFFNKVSLLKLEIRGECNHCDVCVEVCPVDIKVYDGANSGECIRCMNCLKCGKVKVTAPLLRPKEVAAADGHSLARPPMGQSLDSGRPTTRPGA